MTKAKALKLKPGDKITWGDHWRTDKCTEFQTGVVEFVTAKGGIKVRPIWERQTWRAGKPAGWQKVEGEPEWVAYHKVVSQVA